MNLNIKGKRMRTKFIQFDDDYNLYCYKCKTYKPIHLFDINSENWYRAIRDRRCKECKRLQALKRKEENRGKQDLERLLLERWHGAKDRAKRYNIQFNLTLEYLKELWLKQQGKCAISNIDMTYVFNCGRIPTNVSIDRIDSAKGYIMNNIQLVCMACNQMKSDLFEHKLYEFCKAIVNNYESKNNKNSQ